MTIRKFLFFIVAFMPLCMASTSSAAFLRYPPGGFQRGHEIRLGVGAFNFYTIAKYWGRYEEAAFYNGWHQKKNGQYLYNNGWNDNFSVEDNMNTYKGAEVTTGTIQLSYNYRISRWFEFSLYGAYTGFFRPYYSTYDNSRVRVASESLIGLMPNIRVVWLNNRAFRFYSGFGMGLAAELTENYSDVFPVLNINYLGFTFGSKLYGFAELSAGALGMVSAGIGYKF